MMVMHVSKEAAAVPSTHSSIYALLIVHSMLINYSTKPCVSDSK